MSNLLPCAFCGNSELDVDIELNGVNVSRIWEDIANGSWHNFKGEFLLQLSPGTYTIRLTAHSYGPDIQLKGIESNFPGRMILLMIPE